MRENTLALADLALADALESLAITLDSNGKYTNRY